MAKKNDKESRSQRKDREWREGVRFRQSLLERGAVSPERFGMANWGAPPAPNAPKAEWDKFNAEMKWRAPMAANPETALRMQRQRNDLVTQLSMDKAADPLFKGRKTNQNPKANALQRMLERLKGGKGGPRLPGIGIGGGAMPWDVR